MRTADLWLWSLILGLCFTGLIIYLLSRSTGDAPPFLSKKRSPKPLKPRPADDCAQCRTPRHLSPQLLPADPPPPPWSHVKSPRGRKKSFSTEG